MRDNFLHLDITIIGVIIDAAIVFGDGVVVVVVNSGLPVTWVQF